MLATVLRILLLSVVLESVAKQHEDYALFTVLPGA